MPRSRRTRRVATASSSAFASVGTGTHAASCEGYFGVPEDIHHKSALKLRREVSERRVRSRHRLLGPLARFRSRHPPSRCRAMPRSERS
jgi:hypothetical protein